MDTLTILWTATVKLTENSDKNEEHDNIVTFIHDQMLGHAVKPEDIGFMGMLYGLNHVSVRVPGLLELALGRYYKNHEDRLVHISPQRLHLADEREAGLEKLTAAFLAFHARLGIICWYGLHEFEISLVSSTN